ncbi:MAG: GAF domain-containing protein [Firmicutes bacterium]|nr:GAF domain-containing protein [Bacillota bacterium]
MNMDHEVIEMLSSLTRISTELHSSQDMQKALDIISRAACESLKVYACTIKILNERRNKLDIFSNYGLTEDFIIKAGPYGMYKSPVNQKAIEGETVVIENIENCEYELPQELIEEGIKSIICIPMKSEDLVLGVLSIYHTSPRVLDKKEMAFINALTVQGAVAIESLRRSKRVETLMNISKTVGMSLDLNYVINEIVVQAARAMKARAASLRLLDETTNRLVFKSSFGLSRHYLDLIPRTLENSPVDVTVMEEKKVVEIHDMTEDPIVQVANEAREEGLVSMLCSPLLIQDKSIGILKIYTATKTTFSEEEKNFLMAMSELCAIAIRNASLYEKLHSTYLVSSSFSSTIELDRVMELITIHSCDYLNALGAQLLLWDHEKNRFAGRSIYKVREEFVNSINMNKAWSALEGIKGNTIVISNLDEDERIVFKEAALKEDIHSLVSVPLKSMDRTIGVLQVYCKQPRNFSSDEIEFLTVLANHGAISIENAKLHTHFKSKYEDLVDDIYVWHDWTSYVIRE